MPRAREFEIIDRFFRRDNDDDSVLVGIGDDAAIVDTTGPIAIAADTIVSGTHFPVSLPARAIGHRALAVNLSDLAACGATPRWATLVLSLPDVNEEWLAEFADGFFSLAERFGVTLIGGDTTRGPLAATVQIIGTAPPRPLLRSGGETGDQVFVSGMPGVAAAGLNALQQDSAAATAQHKHLIERFSFPEPRVNLGIALAGLAHAAIDVSDGLVADLGHICEQSACGAVIDLDSLPLTGADRTRFSPDEWLRFALYGGDDYELCFAVAPADADAVRARADGAGTPITRIGELVAGDSVAAHRAGQRVELDDAGFRHFGES